MLVDYIGIVSFPGRKTKRFKMAMCNGRKWALKRFRILVRQVGLTSEQLRKARKQVKRAA